MAKRAKIIIVFCIGFFVLLTLIFISIKHREGDMDLSINNENVLFLEGKRDVSLIHVSEVGLSFSAVNDIGFHNLYVINYSDNEITMLDYNISIFQRVQYSNGYIYYSKLYDDWNSSFRRVRITDGFAEDVIAVDEFYFRENRFTLSTAYVINSNYLSSLTYRHLSGTLQRFIVEIDSEGEVRVINDLIGFYPRDLIFYENNLLLSGTNGIYLLSEERGGLHWRIHHKQQPKLLAVSEGRVFFGTRYDWDRIVDINYMPLCGCANTNIFSGEVANVDVLYEWVYFISIEDSSKVKRVNIYSGEIQSLSDARVKDFIIDASGNWLYYQRTYLIGSQIRRHRIHHTELTHSESLFNIVCYGEINILWDDGILRYGSRIECNNLVIYAIDDNSTNMVQLAVFQPLMFEREGFWDVWIRPQELVYFGVVDDWIILSVGEFQGSGNFFYGGIFRVRRDGSKTESFDFGEWNPRFIVINGWIYHIEWEGNEARWFRVRPDGSGKEFLSVYIHDIFVFANDGYIYGAHSTDAMLNEWSPVINLVRWQPDRGKSVTLFMGKSLPIFDESSHMGFRGIEVTDDYVKFTVYVWGFNEDFGWRGSFLYTADYRVDKDGNNLMLLNEEYH